ncbi:MAG: VOC family protein [Acidimicrobiia bacterium]|nr:VOC family protein [Acidimicrobiia bacterium]MYG57515.1 VOC family protein [Acidimicrobiia bacterium]MYJ34275.1 VOC family protein [Acidimicrobiia bacterium]
MIHGVHHIALSTGNLARMRDFYTELLGFEVVDERGWTDNEVIDSIVGLENSSASSLILRAGNVFIELFQFHEPIGAPSDPDRPVCDHGYTHLALNVSDIDAEYERLRAAGMRFHRPPPTEEELGERGEKLSLRATYGRDPDGNVIELQEVLDPHMPFAMDKAGFRPGD